MPQFTMSRNSAWYHTFFGSRVHTEDELASSSGRNRDVVRTLQATPNYSPDRRNETGSWFVQYTTVSSNFFYEPPFAMPLSVESTLGASFIGFNLSCVVFGVVTTQCYTFFSRYPHDRVAYKLLVASLWCLELVDQCFIGHATYHYTITNYANPLASLREHVVWTMIAQIMLGALVGTIVKLCFAMRVWRFSNNVPITLCIVTLVVGQFGGAIAFTIRAYQMNYFSLLPKLKMLGTVSLGAGVLTDIVIAAALCYTLRSFRTGYAASDTLVNSLTIYAINTGALTSIISLCTLILYNKRPTDFYFIGCYFVLSKFYAVSFLCTLNTRKATRGRGTDRNTSRTRTRPSVYMATNYTRGGQPPANPQSQVKSIEIGVVHEDPLTSPGRPGWRTDKNGTTEASVKFG